MAKKAARLPARKSRRPAYLMAALLLTGSLAFALYQLSGHTAPDVPDPDQSVMEPPVAEKIQARREAVFENPDSSEAWGELGVVFLAHSLEEEAATSYRKALELSPGNFQWQYLLVHALMAFDREAALDESTKALELNPDYPALYVVHGELLEESGNTEEAAAAYERALELDPGSAMAALNAGRLAMTRGDLERAKNLLERASSITEASAVSAALARLYRRLGDNERAREEAQKVGTSREVPTIADPIHFHMMQESVSSTARLQRAVDAEAAGQLDEARGIYEDLVVLRPDDADLRVRLADLDARSGRRDSARAQYEAALAISSSHAAAHFGLGALLTREEDYDAAIRHFESSLEARPDHVPTLVSLASTLAFRGRTEEALGIHLQAVELDPDSVPANRSLAEFYVRQKDCKGAVPHFQKVLEQREDVGVVRVQLGACLAMMGDFVSAWPHLKRAKEMGTRVPDELYLEVERRVAKAIP